MCQIISYSDINRSMPHTGISFNSTVLYCPSAWLNDGATAHDTTYTQTLGFFWPFNYSITTNKWHAVESTELIFCNLYQSGFSRSCSWSSGLSKCVVGTAIHKPSSFLSISWDLFIGHHSYGNRIRQQLRCSKSVLEEKKLSAHEYGKYLLTFFR